MDDQDDNLARLRPLNAYGRSKQLFDLHAQREGLLNRIVGLKYFNVFGPNEDHKGDMRSLVNKAYQQILATGKVRLFKSYKPEFKDGEQQRDFLYVKDAVEMTLHFAEQATTASGLYNIGSGQANTWLALDGAPSSPPSAGRRPSNSSRCPRRCATNTSTSPGPTSPSCAGRATRRRSRRSARRCGDYVTNHLVPGQAPRRIRRPAARLRDLGPVLDEQLPQDGTVAVVFVLAIAAHREIGRVRQRGQEFEVVPGLGRGHFRPVLPHKRRPLRG